MAKNITKRHKPRARRIQHIARQMERLKQVRPQTVGEVEHLLHVSNSAARRLLGRLKNEN